MNTLRTLIIDPQTEQTLLRAVASLAGHGQMDTARKLWEQTLGASRPMVPALPKFNYNS